MQRSWLFVGLIIVWSYRFVNAAEKISFKDQVQIAILKGEDFSFKSNIADHMGIERNLPSRVLEVDSNHAMDGFLHDFNVISKDGSPICVILGANKETMTEAHTSFYRVTLKGKLERALDQAGRFDAEHKPIRGSGVITDKKLTPEVKAGFQHELDFWLKGMYRKPVAEVGSTVVPGQK